MHTPHAENNTATQQSKQKPRAQLDHALLDVHMWSKPKLKTLRLKFGQLARLWYSDITLDLSAATNAEIDEELALALAEELGIEDPVALLSYCLEKGLLFSPSPGRISSVRVVEDQEKLAEQREKWRRKKGDPDTPPGDSPEIPLGSSSVSPKSLNVQDCEEMKSEDLKNEDLNKKRTVIPDPPGCSPLELGGLPKEFQNRELIIAWKRYRIKKFKRWKSDYDRISFDSDAMRYCGRIKDFIRDLNAAAAGEWKNVGDASQLEQRGGGPKHESFHERERRERKERLAKFAAEDDSDEKRIE